jgi:hypothetical protein
LNVHEYFHGVSDESLEELARHARVTHHPAGIVVLHGRLKAVRID